MKRILFFLLLLVNLQLTTDNGSLSIGFGEVSAQRVQEVNLAKVITRSSWNYVSCWFCHNPIPEDEYDEHLKRKCEYHWVECEWCNHPVIAATLDRHQYKDCPYRTVYCDICNEPYIWALGHECQHCPYCGRTLGYGEYCDCPEFVINGEKPWWMKYGYPGEGGITGGRFDGGDISGGNGNNGNNGTSQPEQNPKLKDTDPYPRSSYSMKELKALSGFKMVKNLPNKLHIQPQDTRECCPRAIAFLLELKKQKGFNYDKVLGELKNIAINEGCDLIDYGVPFVPKDKIVNLYGNYNVTGDALSESAIIKKIDQGIPVAIGVVDPCPHIKKNHMVTVIGYDSEYIYVAAGNPDGSANMIPRTDFVNNRSWFSTYLYYIK